ncbi:MAG: Mut7-C RNAse domain-containing protein [Ignisphaera sp.]|uniref:Mut7-C RNAse domain-containing protein n=1 Tax=Ignisphaera aggregans TaxID=334771 RepID=A0A7J3MXE8_9CREN
MPSYPRFIADSMLGHIARWLRLLGYDTLYYRAISDWRLMKIAKEEDRILLTRDLGLYRRARKNGVRTLFIEEPSLEKVLAILSIRYSIRLDFDKNDTRCPNCNNQLKYTTSLIEVSHKIDKNIALKYNEFWICNSCDKIYWQGNHWKTITELLDRAKTEKLKILNRVKPLEKNV